MFKFSDIIGSLMQAGASQTSKERLQNAFGSGGEASGGGLSQLLGGTGGLGDALSGLFGGLAGWSGGALSALLPDMPAGAVIVLAAASIFGISFLVAPQRGVLAWAFRQLRLRLRTAENRALLAISAGFLPPDGLSRLVARARGFMDRRDRPTAKGAQLANEARRQMALWHRFVTENPDEALTFRPLSGLRIEDALPADTVAALERRDP